MEKTIVKTKTCSKCGETKDTRNFRRHKATKDKLDSWCRACHNVESIERSQKYKLMKKPAVSEKWCSGCNATLPIKLFNQHSQSKDGWRNICKSCEREMRRACHKRNPAYKMAGGARSRAKKGGYLSDITAEYLHTISDFLKCRVCQQEFHIRDGYQNGRTPSLDKINPDLGYVRGNVMVICCSCNRRKNNQTPQQMRELANALEREQERVNIQSTG